MKLFGHSIEILKSASNGDCFFDSLRQAITSVDVNVTTQQLRTIVAQSVLDLNDAKTSSTILSWVNIYKHAVEEKDRALIQDYKHVDCLLDFRNPLSRRARKTLFEEMCDPKSYWGEEHAIRIIERDLDIKLFVFDKKTMTLLDLSIVQDNWSPRYFVCLAFDKQGPHYEPISIDNQMIFCKDTLPDFLKKSI